MRSESSKGLLGTGVRDRFEAGDGVTGAGVLGDGVISGEAGSISDRDLLLSKES